MNEYSLAKVQSPISSTTMTRTTAAVSAPYKSFSQVLRRVQSSQMPTRFMNFLPTATRNSRECFAGHM